MASRNYYDILGVTKNASASEIKKAYYGKKKNKIKKKSGEEDKSEFGLFSCFQLEKDPHVAFALVIDGKTLVYSLEDEMKHPFLSLAVDCESVICCRVSPKQQALAVMANVTPPLLSCSFWSGFWLPMGTGAKEGYLDGKGGAAKHMPENYDDLQLEFIPYERQVTMKFPANALEGEGWFSPSFSDSLIQI